MPLINADCRTVLPALGPIFDCAIADPPYGDTSLDWDKQVRGWIPIVGRALKPTSSIWIFGSMRFLAPIVIAMEAEGFRYSQDIVWEKQNGTGRHNDRFRRVHEHAVLFYRGAWSQVHHETQFTMDATAKTVRRKTRPAHWGAGDSGVYTSHDGGPRMMRSVLRVRNEHGRAIHPTQKPVELLQHLVRYSCPRRGMLLDPFAGSAAVEIAGRAVDAQYFGFETDPDHYAAATSRIAS